MSWRRSTGGKNSLLVNGAAAARPDSPARALPVRSVPFLQRLTRVIRLQMHVQGALELWCNYKQSKDTLFKRGAHAYGILPYKPNSLLPHLLLSLSCATSFALALS